MARLWKKSFNPPNPGPEIYESVAEARKQLIKPANYQRYAREILDLLPIQSGKLLDVGCGLGWLVKEADSRGFEALGMDTSKTLVRLGKKALAVNLRNSLPSRQKFDIIIAKHVLEHIKETDQFSQKIFRLLSPTGYFLVACPNNSSLMHWIFGNRWYGLCPAQHVWQFTPKSLTAILRRNGFKIENVIINSLDYQPPGFKSLVFKILVNFANIFQIGDQVVVICRRR